MHGRVSLPISTCTSWVDIRIKGVMHNIVDYRVNIMGCLMSSNTDRVCWWIFPLIDFDENQESVSGKERTVQVQVPPSQLRPQRFYFFIKKDVGF